jgi:hypothetical protein
VVVLTCSHSANMRRMVVLCKRTALQRVAPARRQSGGSLMGKTSALTKSIGSKREVSPKLMDSNRSMSRQWWPPRRLLLRERSGRRRSSANRAPISSMRSFFNSGGTVERKSSDAFLLFRSAEAELGAAILRLRSIPPCSPPPRSYACVQQDKPCVCCSSARRAGISSRIMWSSRA